MSEFKEMLQFKVPVAFLPFRRALVNEVTGELISSNDLLICSLAGVQLVLDPVAGFAWRVVGAAPGGRKLVCDLGGWFQLYSVLGVLVRKVGAEQALRAYSAACWCGAVRRCWVSRPVAA